MSFTAVAKTMSELPAKGKVFELGEFLFNHGQDHEFAYNPQTKKFEFEEFTGFEQVQYQADPKDVETILALFQKWKNDCAAIKTILKHWYGDVDGVTAIRQFPRIDYDFFEASESITINVGDKDTMDHIDEFFKNKIKVSTDLNHATSCKYGFMVGRYPPITHATAFRYGADDTVLKFFDTWQKAFQKGLVDICKAIDLKEEIGFISFHNDRILWSGIEKAFDSDKKDPLPEIKITHADITDPQSFSIQALVGDVKYFVSIDGSGPYMMHGGAKVYPEVAGYGEQEIYDAIMKEVGMNDGCGRD